MGVVCFREFGAVGAVRLDWAGMGINGGVGILVTRGRDELALGGWMDWWMECRISRFDWGYMLRSWFMSLLCMHLGPMMRWLGVALVDIE